MLQVGAGLLLALLYVFHLRRGSALVRTLVFFPVVVPTVAIAEMFAKLFAIAPQYGLVNSLLHAFGMNGSVQDWLANGSSAFFVLVIMDVWRSMGFYAVLLYAGLVDIPEDVIESARLDGASGYRLVRHVLLPFLGPVLFSALIFSINGTLKVFDSVVALTNGGPGQATTPLTLYMFNNAFSYGEYGYASTIATALALIVPARDGRDLRLRPAGRHGMTEVEIGGTAAARLPGRRSLRHTRPPARRRALRALGWIGIALLLVVELYPLLWLFLQSFKTSEEITLEPDLVAPARRLPPQLERSLDERPYSGPTSRTACSRPCRRWC